MDFLTEATTHTYTGTVIGFIQVFLGTATVVLLFYWAKSRVLPAPAPRRPEPRPQPAAVLPRVRLSRGWPRLRWPRRRRTKPTPQYFEVSRPIILAPMPASLHWQRASAPLRAFIAHANRAQDLHARAATRLDSADYALQRLMADLAPVMHVPRRAAVMRRVPHEDRASPSLPTSLAA